MKQCNLFYLTLLVLFVSFLPMSAGASVLGTAGEFNTFIFGDYACTSDAEGRVAVGGNMTVSNYSVADKLTPQEVEKYHQDMLIVGGNLNYSNGRVYYGNIRVGGKATMPAYIPDGELIKNQPLPINFAAEEASLKSLSSRLSQRSPNGSVEAKWGGLYLQGDGTSALQIFTLDGSQTLNAHTFSVSNLAAGATVLFNISGTTAGLTNMSMESLQSFQHTTLFNFYEATTLQLSGIAVRGSILAPFAAVNNPQGVIWGSIIAASWNGPMQQNHVPFTGQLPDDQETDDDNSDNDTLDEVVITLDDNKHSQYKITFVEHTSNTWTYKVEELNGRSLSHWDLGISSCLGEILTYTPQTGFAQGTDGSTGFVGIKWDLSDNFTSGNFSFTLDGDYPEGIVEVLAKAGTKFAIANIIGPVCDATPGPPDETPWESDLAITKTAPAQAEVGDTITYTLTVTNNGPQNSQIYEGRGVKLTDTLPEGVTVLSVTPSQGTCDESITCDLGAINSFQSATVQVQVKVEQAGSIVNTATVSPERPGDPNLVNNTASVETVVTAPQPPQLPIQDILLIGINDDLDRFEIYNTATKIKTFPKAFEFVITGSGGRQRVEASKVPDGIKNLVYVSEGTYYGIQSFPASENPDGTSQLYKFTLNHDTTEITIEKVGQPFSGTDIDSIEYGDGVFYAMDNKTQTLLVVDLNGTLISSKSISNLGLTYVAGLAYKDGLLYASDTNDHNSSLVSINVLNGLDGLLGSDIQYIGQIGYGQVGALTFVDDILYGASDFHDSLFSIDLGTGFGVFMDNWGASIEGIAGVYPGTITAVPEPGTLILLVSGVLGLLALCKKRQR